MQQVTVGMVFLTNIPPVCLAWHPVTPEEWWVKAFIRLTAVSESHFSTNSSISTLANVFILGRPQCFVCVCLASHGHAWSKEGLATLPYESVSGSEMLPIGSCPFCSPAALQTDHYWDEPIEPTKGNLTCGFSGATSDRKEFKYSVHLQRLRLFLFVKRNNTEACSKLIRSLQNAANKTSV